MRIKEDTGPDILQIVKDKFGVVDTPYNGPSFILPDGYFLDLRRYTHHSDVEKFLIDNGYSDYEYGISLGSPTMKDLGCIRVDTLKYYITVPDRINSTQLNSLLIWLDYLSRQIKVVEVITPDNQHIIYHLDDEVISDYIVDRIKRYYTTGRLLEDNQIASKHQFEHRYGRLDIGKPINLVYYPQQRK